MPDDAQRPIIIAHRGASAQRPEHSRSAYLTAIAQGADAVEPDLVASRDGVLVIRHENELSATTDIADRPEFADRRRQKTIDGAQVQGWFTEDFDWAEIQTLRCRERLSALRPESAAYDDTEPVLRFTQLLELLDASDRGVELVAELKHAQYFRTLGLGLEERLAEDLRGSGWMTGRPLSIEAFEESALHRVHALGIEARRIYLMEDDGSAQDASEADGTTPLTFAQQRTRRGLRALSGRVDGISVSVRVLGCDSSAESDESDPDGARPDQDTVSDAVDPDSNAVEFDRNAADLDRELRGRELVEVAHENDLLVFGWTLRAEREYVPDGYIAQDGDRYGAWQAYFRDIYATGVDAIFADQVDLALAARMTSYDAGLADDGTQFYAEDHDESE